MDRNKKRAIGLILCAFGWTIYKYVNLRNRIETLETTLEIVDTVQDKLLLSLDKRFQAEVDERFGEIVEYFDD